MAGIFKIGREQNSKEVSNMNATAYQASIDTKSTPLGRFLIFAFGVISYLAFLATFLYAIGFIGNFGVPKTLDSPAEKPLLESLLIDAGLLSLFALQHSIMARRGFKRMITRVVPHAAERSVYVLASSLALGLLFWKWQPLGGIVWNVETDSARALLYTAYAFGLLLVLVSTFAINHFDLFGLRQVWRALQGQDQAKNRFVLPFLYRIVRHPLYVGWIFTFWSTPTMTLTHLFFAVMTTVYMLVAIQFEEADLIREHPEYEQYRKEVPMIIPGFRRQPPIIESVQRMQP